jgi:hypothetical protein
VDLLADPVSVEAEFGMKSRVPVSGTINGFAFRNLDSTAQTNEPLRKPWRNTSPTTTGKKP